MKTKIIKYTLVITLLFFLIACSVKKNTFLSRNYHALSTRDNILYNGNIGLNKGIEGIKSGSKDNFWQTLPVEKMQPIESEELDKPKNADFEISEAKATKAIQKHSMNIDGNEKNPQIDEAYLLLGKTRYYDGRFIPAIDAFNYILHKYPNSDKINEAKIWREKTNMRMDNDALVVKNINKLLKENKLNNQDFVNANALLSDAYLNLEKKDSAVLKLKIAEQFAKNNNDKTRFRFILGQLYQELDKKDSALYFYQKVINMKRKAEKAFVINAQARKTQLFDYQTGDTTQVLETYKKLIADRENRPFLDVIYYQLALYYDKGQNQKQAIKNYNISLKKQTTDPYLTASNYRNIGNIDFKNTDYQIAAKYYDSTLTKLGPKTKEYFSIKKTRKNLDEVIEYETVAKRDDSILNLISLSETDRTAYFEKVIEKLKKADEAQKTATEKARQKQENIERNNRSNNDDVIIQPNGATPNIGIQKPSALPTIASNGASNTFYFYNPTNVALGKVAFKKTWGDRQINTNWRVSTNKNNTLNTDAVVNTDNPNIEKEQSKTDVDTKETEKYTVNFYIKNIPTKQTEIDSIVKERNKAYYQLGVLYKEKFKEYKLASGKLEQLLQNKPEEKLVAPAMYNLYKIYQITDAEKSEKVKNTILLLYPNSRYAQIINNKNVDSNSENESPEKIYNTQYELYKDERFLELLNKSDELINQFTGTEIVSKFELLKANAIAKLYGLDAYKKAMQHVVDFYPKTEEGKNAQEILTTQIPLLEQSNFGNKESNNWKILFKTPTFDDKTINQIEGKLNDYFINEKEKTFTFSCDFYNEKEIFITVHGLKTEEQAKKMITILKENKAYKLETPAVVISNENYRIIQIKKNLDTYLTPKK